jgi:uncharacterized oligopeptide transporter (OPT) family protein
MAEKALDEMDQKDEGNGRLCPSCKVEVELMTLISLAAASLLTMQKGEQTMWNFMGQSGPATAILDFTNDFSVLMIGLVGIVGLSAAMIVWIAIAHYLAQKRRPVVKVPSLAADADEREVA